MRYGLLCTCVLFAIAAVASAQTKITFSGKCAKPENVQSIPAGDKDGHMFMVQTGKCTTAKGEVGGAKSKEGMYSEHGETTGTQSKVWGLYAEMYDSGDKIFYSYQGATMAKEGGPVSGTNTWHMTGGTGKLKGIKGTGGCKFTGNADGGLDYTCTGEYTLAGAKKAE
jgi:hypothetical protein